MGGRHFSKSIARFGIFALLVMASFVLVRCGGTSTTSPGMGSANVTMSDPPSGSQFSDVWVTVDGVSASVNSNGDTGWQTLVSGLSSTGTINAVQLDLMNLPANGQCLLAQLGSTQSLPAGDYQQIRLQLVPNNATNVTLLSPSGEPTTNQCTSVNGWNCAMPTGGSLTILNLSSQAQTGLKIPPGQVMGGPIHVAAGSSVDINIDFNAGRSIVMQGNQQYRLDPVLVAYQVSQNNTGISGKVVAGTISGTTVTPGAGISGANVALEVDPNTNPADGTNNVDLITNWLTTTDSQGNFDFCPLPTNKTFDVVANAGPSTAAPTAAAYNATIITGVPTAPQTSTGISGGTQVTVPLLAETSGPGTITGQVTGASGTTANFDAELYSLQQATSSLEFAVPLFSISTPAMAQISVTCTTSGCTASNFSLSVPASSPLVGTFSGGNITWAPLASAISYNVEATCANPVNGSPQFSGPQTMSGTPPSISLASPLTLTNCQ
jgi:hypothetical protein